MAVVLPQGRQQFFTDAGAFLAGGKVYAYIAGTSTPKDTYTTAAQTIANTNPVILNSRGEAAIYWAGAYDVILKTAADVTIWGPERLEQFATDSDFDAFVANLADTSNAAYGPALVGFGGTLAYAAGTVGGILRYFFGRTGAEITAGVTPTNYGYVPGDVRRYGAIGDFNGTTGTENLTAFQNCILVCQASTDPATYATNSPATGTSVMFVPDGNYKVTGTLTITKKIHIQGPGPAERSSGARILQFNNAVDLLRINPAATGMSFSIDGVTLDATGGGAGHLIHVTHTSATCNSSRVTRCFLATPAVLSIQIDAGDDWQIENNTFDVSNGFAISLGTATAADVVSNVRITNNDFFEIPTRCIILYNVIGIIVANNHVSRQGATRTNYFVDGYNSLPYQIKDVVIEGNVLNSVDCLAKVTGFDGMSILGNRGLSMGSGAGATLSCIEVTGTCSNLNIVANNLSGNFDTKNIYNDAGGTVTGLVINSNTFTATGGAGAPISALNSTGKIDGNMFTGYTANTTLSVQEFTSNKAQWIRGENSEEVTLSTAGLTTDSTANLLPANSIIESVVARVTTTITTTTDWKLGDATIAGRFAPANASLVAGTNTVGLTHIDQAGTSGPRQTAAAKLRITCTGANPGAGKIRVTVFYRQFVAPAS